MSWITRVRAPSAAVIAALALALSASASPGAPVIPGPVEPPVGAVAEGLVSDHVLVISIDGLRPDAIGKFGATTLLRLMREGSYTLNAKTIMPSRTLPSHTSMLTGEEPESHGVTWNRNEMDEHGHAAVPTIFAQASEHGFRTAAFFGKGKFHHLNVPRTLDHARVPDGNGKWNADRVVALVGEHLGRERPNLMFVHLVEPDAAGHTFSWMSWFYGRAVRKADRAVAEILRAADGAFGEGNYTVIVTADHGGHGWGHGSSDPRDVTIPWIAWGKGVSAGRILEDGVRTMDTAATALWLLGIAERSVGEPVVAAFGKDLAPALAGGDAPF